MVAAALAVAAAVVLTVTLAIRSDDPNEFGTPEEAVFATCHAANAYRYPAPGDALARQMYAAFSTLEKRGHFFMYWHAGPRLRNAAVERTPSGMYRVTSCNPPPS